MKSRLAEAAAVCALSMLPVAGTALAHPEPGLSLVEAVEQRDATDVARLVRHRDQVNLRSPDGSSALQWAAHWGDEALIRTLIAQGADVNAHNRYGVTALMEAAANSSGQVTSILLRAGADPQTSFGMGQTALMTASLNGNVAAVTALVNAKTDVNARESRNGQTALMWAAARGHLPVVRLLLAHGAAVDLKDSPVDRNVRKVTQAGGGQLPAGGMTALLFAARNGQLEVVRALLDARAQIDHTEGDGWTPLLLAIVNTHFSVAKLLIERGANLALANHQSITPLYAAVDMRMPDITARPLREQDDAVSSLQLLQILLVKGADPNTKVTVGAGGRNATAGVTPFMRAVRSGDLIAMRTLLDHGAKPTLTMDDGSTAIMFAAGIHSGFGSTAQVSSAADMNAAITLCQQLGIDINASDREGDTALHAAAAASDADMIRLLLSKGARLDARNSQQLTALDIVEGKGRKRPAAALQPALAKALRTLLGGA